MPFLSANLLIKAFNSVQGSQRQYARARFDLSENKAQQLEQKFKKQQGFTLIELIVGMVVLAIALTFITSLIVPQAKKGVQPVLQMRAVELANAIMNEGAAYPFDKLKENGEWQPFSDPNIEINERYASFEINTSVCLSDYFGECTPTGSLLLLQVSITPPLGVPITFTRIKGNY